MSSAPDFGSLLRRYRLASSLSQAALAQKAGMSVEGIGALERGRRRTPQRGTLELLAGALALDPDQRREFEAAALWKTPSLLAQAVTPLGWRRSASDLPSALSTFVGRETELERIASLVGLHRMVTLTGAGGTGKTRIALRIMQQVRDSGNDVIFVELAAVRDPLLIAFAIASTLGVQEIPGRQLFDSLLAHLKNRSGLLILDNCEHVVTEVAVIAERLLTECPDVRILATSREPMKAAGERSFLIPSLKVTDAVALFTERARAVDHRFAINEENASSVEQLCRRLDGIPLAIELAAARVNLMPVSALATKLNRGLGLLSGGVRTASARQLTMRATIDWSYNMLSIPEQRTFERLSTFAGSCRLSAAVTVIAGDDVSSDQVFDLIASLVNKSLLTADLDGSEPRYRMLEPFRDYASEKIEEHGERGILAQRHALATLEFLEQIERFRHAAYDRWMEENIRELDNLRAALEWSLKERNDAILGQRLVARSIAVWVPLAFMEGERWTTMALELINENTPAELAADLTYDVGIFALHVEDYERALPTLESAARQWLQVGNEYEAAQAQTAYGWALTGLGRCSEAVRLLEESLQVRRGFEDHRHGWALRGVAAAHAATGNFVEARRYAAEALQLYLEHYNKAEIAWVYSDLSEYEYCDGNIDAALSYAASMLDESSATHSGGRNVAAAHNGVACALVALKRYDEAAEHAHEVLRLAQEYQEAPLLEALQNIAAIAAFREAKSSERQRSAHSDAARILGFVDASLELTGATRRSRPRTQYRAVIAVVRSVLGTSLTSRLLAEGAAMTQEQAVELATAV